MLVLSRQVDETVMIGDSISVTVVSIGSDMATLFVRYRDETQRVEQKLALEVDDRLEITNDIHVYVVDINEDKVRLGFIAPAKFTVHRKEVYESLQRDSAIAASHLVEPLALAVGEQLQIGENVHLLLAQNPSGDREIRSHGQLVGGPRDGEVFELRHSISVGSTLDFGSLVQVCVVKSTAEAVGLKIQHPMHMICRIQK